MNEEIDLLISKYLDGTATSAEIDWLDAEVRCNPESCRALFLSVDQDNAIRELLNEERCLKALRGNTSFRPEVMPRKGLKSAAWIMGFGAAAAAILVGLLLTANFSSLTMHLEASDDRVIIHRDKHDLSASASCDLKPGDMLIVPEGTGATITYPNRLRLDVGSGSTIVLGRRDGASDSMGDGDAVHVFLKTGAFTADSTNPVAQTVFYAPDSQSLSRGGGLKLQVSNGRTRLDLRRGNVEFLRGEKPAQLLKEGESLVDAGGSGPVIRSGNYVDLKQGLMALWNFHEGSLLDASGNGNDCKLYGAKMKQLAGGSALVFSQPNDAAFAENSPTLNLTGEVSVAAWIYLDRVNNDQKVAGIQDNISGGYKLSVYEDNKMDFIIRDRNNKSHTNRKQPGGTQLKRGQWYHVVGIYSETDHCIKIYVNGVLDRSIHDNTIMPRTTGSFVIGREPWANWDPNRTFCGMIDELRVYNRVLNGAEIVQLSQRRSIPTLAAAE